MSVAIRTATRIVDQDDFGSTPGAGSDGYAVVWDNGAGAFVLAAAGVTDHGALSGLSDDDHTGYALLAGRSGGQTLYGGTASGNNLTLYSTSHATKGNIALGTTLTVDSVNGRVGIGTTNPQAKLDVNGYIQLPNTSQITLGTTWGSGILHFNNGVSTFGSWGAGSLTTNVKMLAASTGFPSAPEYGFRDSASTGMYRPANNQIGFVINAVERLRIDSSGNVGIGTTAPSTILHALTTDTAINAVTNIATLGHNTSGTAAAGFGGGLVFNLQSSTTASQSAGLIASSWIVATHASRTARLALSAYDYNGAREGVRIDTDGSAALLGFYGHAAVAQQVLATGAGASVDNVITALQALGLVKQS